MPNRCCKHCGNNTMMTVSAPATKDCKILYNGAEHDGPIPENLGIGYPGTFMIVFCITCGKMVIPPLTPEGVSDILHGKV